MRKIEWSNALKKDFKRAQATPPLHDVEELLERVVTLLAEDKPLSDSYRDHALIGDWKGYRECHLKSDLLLIYRTEGEDTLRLARLASHSELFKK